MVRFNTYTRARTHTHTHIHAHTAHTHTPPEVAGLWPLALPEPYLPIAGKPLCWAIFVFHVSLSYYPGLHPVKLPVPSTAPPLDGQPWGPGDPRPAQSQAPDLARHVVGALPQGTGRREGTDGIFWNDRNVSYADRGLAYVVV